MFGLRGLEPDLEISGYETAFREIAPRLVSRGHHVTIYCRRGAHSPSRRQPRQLGVDLIYMPSPGGKNYAAVTSTFLAVSHALAARHFDLWFFVNVGMGHHCALARLSGRPVVMNVDGLDWTRAKWGKIARSYFYSAAHSAVRFCTEIVTDAVAMQDYYREHFHRDSVMIPYGADVETSTEPERLAEFGLTPRDYYLIVSRLIPENSLEVMLSAFARTRTKRSLIVVGGANYRDAFHDRLQQIAAGDPRIRLVGQIHDQALLKELWCNCYAYLHGHSVGGTNPALLRAMGYGSCILALDTVFNKEVMADTGVFFPPAPEALAVLIEKLDATPSEVERYRALAPARIREHYTWEKITDDYESLFRRVTA